MRFRRVAGFAAIAVGLLMLAPASGSAGEWRSFELPSPMVDTSTPGGQLPDGRTVPKVNVLLPDGYDRRSRRGYPVLYLLHGAFGGADEWPGIERQLPGFRGIVVMPDGGRFGMYVDWWNGGARGGPAWASYHLRTLRREVERRYRIRPGRRWHAIGGISMGGQGTLRYAAMLPGYFGTAVGFSAALADMQADVAKLGLDALVVAGGGQGVSYEPIFGAQDGVWAEGNNPMTLAPNLSHTRMYLTSGDGTNCPQDPVPPGFALDSATEAAINSLQGPFAAAARSFGADVTDITTCGIHTFGVWDRAIPAARSWGFFEPVPEHPRRWTYRTIATSGEMWGLRFRFTAPPATVAEFTRAGRRLSGTGRGRVKLRGGKGCRLTVRLPFERRLPPACRRPGGP